jgi:APA family basic amino acid/polyamine antiporter
VDNLFFILLVLAVIVLRVRKPDMPRPFRAPGYPFLPILYAVAGAVLIGVLLVDDPRTTWPGYGIALSGVPVYFLWRRRKQRAG